MFSPTSYTNLKKNIFFKFYFIVYFNFYRIASLRDTIGRSYYEARGRYPHEFWQLRAGGGGAKELADETKFMNPGLEQPELMVQALAAHNALTDCLMQGEESGEVIEKVLDDVSFGFLFFKVLRYICDLELILYLLFGDILYLLFVIYLNANNILSWVMWN